MPETGYAFDWDAVERIQAAVEDFESRPLDETLPLSQKQLQSQIHSWCKVLALVTGKPGLYTARVLFTTSAMAWRGGSECYVQEVNSAKLTADSIVQGKCLAYSINGKPVFGVTAGGGGGAGGGIGTVVEVAAQVAGTPIWNGYLALRDDNTASNLPTDVTIHARGDAIYIYNTDYSTSGAASALYPGQLMPAQSWGKYQGKALYATHAGFIRSISMVSDVQCDFGTITVNKRTITVRG